ncbi:hypothetical protein [Ruegeria sp. R14_0]|uniref:hypothetical protein n=1 Tax=Ruegeria sp. R14_0 TaxID=2821100 RepID=UPI001ADCA2B8|nr:hypothetical protein [Ruegeria sp. R14_0]MBO9448435.1 hypothetical protein [Ruegeria sp. R14_0]
MLIRLLFILGAVLPRASALHAEEEFLVQLNTRTFYAGQDYWGWEIDTNFLPINRLDWLNETLMGMPILDYTVVHIKQLNQDSDFLWSPNGPGRLYRYPEPVLKHLRLPGYTVNSSGPNSTRRVYLTPNSAEKLFAVACSAKEDSTTYEFCGLSARYPLDPRIIVLTRIYKPPPMDQMDAYFNAIAELTVGIALCLDVTDQIGKEAKKPVRKYLAEGHTNHCVDGLSS